MARRKHCSYQPYFDYIGVSEKERKEWNKGVRTIGNKFKSKCCGADYSPCFVREATKDPKYDDPFLKSMRMKFTHFTCDNCCEPCEVEEKKEEEK